MDRPSGAPSVLAGVAAAILLGSCGPAPAPDPADRACAVRILECLRGPDDALGVFETALHRGQDSRSVGINALAAARGARDALERIAPTPRLVAARRECLIYLNHVVPALDGYLGRAGQNGPQAEARLASILRRGRAHRRRAMREIESLIPPGRATPSVRAMPALLVAAPPAAPDVGRKSFRGGGRAGGPPRGSALHAPQLQVGPARIQDLHAQGPQP